MCNFPASISVVAVEAAQWQVALQVLDMMPTPTALCLAAAVETCEKGPLDSFVKDIWSYEFE